MISSSKSIIPLLNKVVIKKVAAPKAAAKQLSKTTSGLYIPESQKVNSLAGNGNFSKAQILSISEQLKEKSVLNVGDFVLYPSQLDHLTSVKVESDGSEGEQVLLVNLEDLVAKVAK
ncbi:hypothetical protein ACO0SA_000406 [Hanseniaspora valbyensis]